MPTLERDSDSVSIKEWSIPAPAPCANVKMHLGLSGVIYLADTVPMEGETFNLRVFVLIVGAKLQVNRRLLCYCPFRNSDHLKNSSGPFKPTQKNPDLTQHFCAKL